METLVKGNIVESKTINGRRMLHYVVKVEACRDLERYPVCVTLCRMAKAKDGVYVTFGHNHTYYWCVDRNKYLPHDIKKVYNTWEELEGAR